MGEFSGKNVLVTGATSGIGRAIAEAFGAEGARVGALGRRRQEAEETAALVRARGGEGVPLTADIRSPAQIHEAVAFFVGERPGLSVAVNCAGLDVSHYLVDYSVEEFDRLFETNTRGLFCCMQEEIAMMRAGGGGAIVNITSVSGQRPHVSNSAYNASKSAASMLTRTAAAEEGPNGIRINEIAPGPIDTPMLRKFFEDAKSAGWDSEKLRQSQPLRRIGARRTSLTPRSSSPRREPVTSAAPASL